MDAKVFHAGGMGEQAGTIGGRQWHFAWSVRCIDTEFVTLRDLPSYTSVRYQGLRKLMYGPFIATHPFPPPNSNALVNLSSCHSRG